MISEFLAGLVGYFLCQVVTKPGTKINKRMPTLKLKSLQLLPTIQIRVKGKVIHVHHWLHLSLVFIVSIIIDNGFWGAPVFRGLLLGGIAQGFTFPDWKRIIIKTSDFKILTKQKV